MTEKYKYVVAVQTGDKKFAGTDANIAIVLHSDDGQQTDEMWLDNIFINDFERGRQDEFPVTGCRIDTVDFIELWRDEAGVLDNWFLDFIEVKCEFSEQPFVFPFFRWIKPHYRYRIRHLDTSLPQEDVFKDQRSMELEDKRSIYEVKVKVTGMTAQVIIKHAYVCSKELNGPVKR